MKFSFTIIKAKATTIIYLKIEYDTHFLQEDKKVKWLWVNTLQKKIH